MKLKLIVVGKTDQQYLQEGIREFHQRIVHYLPFEYQIVNDIRNSRNLTEEQQKEKEGEVLLQKIALGDEIILLDVLGQEIDSIEFARFLEKKMVSSIKNLVFMVGGPYGFSPAVYKMATTRISLSKMTFSHQLVRLVFSEQLYRALTIIKGEPYHH
jgi:Uncharacterized conserved protein